MIKKRDKQYINGAKQIITSKRIINLTSFKENWLKATLLDKFRLQ